MSRTYIEKSETEKLRPKTQSACKYVPDIKLILSALLLRGIDCTPVDFPECYYLKVLSIESTDTFSLKASKNPENRPMLSLIMGCNNRLRIRRGEIIFAFFLLPKANN